MSENYIWDESVVGEIKVQPAKVPSKIPDDLTPERA